MTPFLSLNLSLLCLPLCLLFSLSLSLLYRCVSISLLEAAQASQCLSLVLSCGSLCPSCSEPLSPACSQASVRVGGYPVAPASDTTAGDRLCLQPPGEHRPCLMSPALLLSESQGAAANAHPAPAETLSPSPHTPTFLPDSNLLPEVLEC